MNAIRPYILLILVASLFLSGCAGTQKVSKINQGDFTPALAKSVKAGEFFPLDFSFKNGDGPEITAIRVSIAEADAVKASDQPSAGGSVKAAGKSVVFDNIRIEKGATFQGSLLVRVDTPGAVPLGIVPAVKTDVWQSLERIRFPLRWKIPIA